jgi:hypothetical protein
MRRPQVGLVGSSTRVHLQVFTYDAVGNQVESLRETSNEITGDGSNDYTRTFAYDCW